MIVLKRYINKVSQKRESKKEIKRQNRQFVKRKNLSANSDRDDELISDSDLFESGEGEMANENQNSLDLKFKSDDDINQNSGLGDMNGMFLLNNKEEQKCLSKIQQLKERRKQKKKESNLRFFNELNQGSKCPTSNKAQNSSDNDKRTNQKKQSLSKIASISNKINLEKSSRDSSFDNSQGSTEHSHSEWIKTQQDQAEEKNRISNQHEVALHSQDKYKDATQSRQPNQAKVLDQNFQKQY